MRTLHAQFVKGADIGWLDQMESTGYKFYDTTGTEKNCLQILKDYEINTLRLRVWVNPDDHKINGHCSKKEVVKMALRAKEMGMRVMIDFHYSDSWADPQKQNKPAAWATHTISQLLDDVYNHTFEVLDSLKKSGVVPAWVQIGNEIIGGMLWPEGSTNNWPQLALLLNKGYDAVKAVDNSIQVIVHIDQGNDNTRCRWFYDNAKSNSVRYDIIGLSYYPFWLGTDYTSTINDLGNNLKDMVSRYGKPVMIVEVGGEFDKVQNTYNMLVAVLDKVRAVPGNKGLGVIYWEPEGEKSWSGYSLSCWSSDGKPTAAMNAFRSHGTGLNHLKNTRDFNLYPNPCHGQLNVASENPVTPGTITILDLWGRILDQFDFETTHRFPVNLDLSPGMYLISINEGESVSYKTFMVD